MLQQRFRNAGEATHGATWHGDGPWQLLFRHVSSRVALSILGDNSRKFCDRRRLSLRGKRQGGRHWATANHVLFLSSDCAWTERPTWWWRGCLTGLGLG